ncbi:sporulation YhaL family protein [Siminovitchia sediminis]|uniref:Sporulation YhaL family protein n=1 Tax=Siminovitchia sediminis TaxID=1274353 RepID=A0ABW4KJU0_9BACI
MSLPIWLYFVIAGIFVSAFMAIKSAREDHQFEKEWIEKEGEVYIERMEEEKERRRNMRQAGHS